MKNSNRSAGRQTPKNKRTPDQAEKDREKIAALYLQGWSQIDIAKQLGVTQPQISYDLKIIRKAWIKTQQEAYDQKIATEVEKYNKIERELWEAWENSKKEETTTFAEKGMTPKGEVDKKTIRKKTSYGIPAYLLGIQDCIDKRVRLQHLDLFAAIDSVSRQGYQVVDPRTGDVVNFNANTTPSDSSEDSE